MTLPEKLDRGEAIRYLGGTGIELTDEMNALIDDCERELLSVIAPKYRCITVALPCEEIMRGEDFRRHLEGCDRAVMLCAILGAEPDRVNIKATTEEHLGFTGREEGIACHAVCLLE